LPRDAAAAARFGWHQGAGVTDADGIRHGKGPGPAPSGPTAAVIADRPAVAALRAALDAAARGQAFRIDPLATGAPPEGEAVFETLTGGSTGTPRRIRRQQGSWLASFAVNARRFGIGPGVGVAVLGRLSHSLALYGAVEALCLGAELHLLDGMRPDRQRAALARRRVSVLYATPAQVRGLAAGPGPDLPLAFVLVGGAKLDLATRAAIAAMAPRAAVLEFYGAAETSFVTLADATTAEGSVGRAYPGVGIAIRSPGGQPLAEGEPGEVWVRSPYLSLGYAGTDPGSARWQDGWCTVGEWGRMQGDCLFLLGRAGRMLTIADQNVFPDAVEAALLSLPGVAQAAVLPRPDPRRGQVLDAVLQGDPGAETAILRAARQMLGPLAAPRRVLWLPGDWPQLPSGKTDLVALARLVGAAGQGT
jgi:long-chain acyl-CoA synthetase